MKKIIAAAAMVLASVAFAAPAHADNDSNFDGPISAADNWNFTAGVVCLQEVAVVPALSGAGGYVGDHENNCSNGNVIDHS
ncbi:hypothetical protein OKJ48_36090 [Streptomyces kunmingensis]|uniref:Secreted protein n=1 Tax=Streptomyces kunmingensis TaxID=68225 RepID=A0ABU6CNF5_9ACTN|nr:hypothetical protein [Streptomyces kunmingensis]MEB3965612.1 hypothetical protein [Streptomyces kunmingensis]